MMVEDAVGRRQMPVTGDSHNKKGRILRGSAGFGRARRNLTKQRLVASRGQLAVHFFFGNTTTSV